MSEYFFIYNFCFHRYYQICYHWNYLNSFQLVWETMLVYWKQTFYVWMCWIYGLFLYNIFVKSNFNVWHHVKQIWSSSAYFENILLWSCVYNCSRGTFLRTIESFGFFQFWKHFTIVVINFYFHTFKRNIII